ncbi:MAG: hypothetical protein J6N53_17990 [Lachnospiraceae bacterium]|nr:hypothetical protein [Lachnospiraceae bacterium]
MNYYIVHAGMVQTAFDMINEDMRKDGLKQSYAYRIDESVSAKGSPFHQITYSRHGLYSQKPHFGLWVAEKDLKKEKACIIHGHTPYCFFVHDAHFSYGNKGLFWEQQHIFFSENMQSFNIDSDIKGRSKNGQTYRGLSCICLEVIEEIAAKNEGVLTCEGIKEADNFVFAESLKYGYSNGGGQSIDRVLDAKPDMKAIFRTRDGSIVIE